VEFHRAVLPQPLSHRLARLCRHGDSGNRSEYTPLGFVRDIIGVLDHAGFEQATLIGHSFGGGRVARACAEYPRECRAPSSSTVTCA
jgi:pimeloyl-ACP methyl ester carboxylesterase